MDDRPATCTQQLRKNMSSQLEFSPFAECTHYFPGQTSVLRCCVDKKLSNDCRMLPTKQFSINRLLILR